MARLHLLGGEPAAARDPAAAAALAALGRGRFAEARRWLFLHDALPPAPGDPTPFAIAAAKARVALVTESEEPRDLLVEGCEAAAVTADDHAEAAVLRADYQLRQGHPRPALVAALRVASPGRAPSPNIAVRALLLATRCRLRLGQWDDARTQLTRAEAFLAVGASPELSRAVALMRAQLLLDTQDLDAAGAQAEALLVLARAEGHVRDGAQAGHLLAQVLRLVGRRRRAEKLARAATSAAGQSGDLALEAQARLTLAELLVERGDAGAARPLLHAAIRRLRGLRLDHEMPRALRVVLQSALSRGDPHEADVALASFRIDPLSDPEAPAALVRWWRTRGDLQAALAVPAPELGTWGHMLWRVERARAHLVHSDPVQAERDATIAREAAAERGFDELELYARLLQQFASDVDEATWAATAREAAAQVWTELGFGALELDARRKSAAGDDAGAKARWQALRARCAELGYQPGWQEATGWLGDAP
jgi:hypothetical protein